MIRIVRPGIGNIVQDLVRVKTKSRKKRPNLPRYLWATARSLSGLKVPSVSMYMHLPEAPPWSAGSYAKMDKLDGEFT